MLIPQPKEQNLQNGVFCFENLTCSIKNEDVAFSKHFFDSYYPNFFTIEENSNVLLCKKESFVVGEYTLSIDEQVQIEYAEREGLRNALATLIQLILPQGKSFSIQKQLVKDKPECQYRSVLIDLARGLPDYGRLKEDIKRLALAKCNYVHLHLMDSMGICYESNVLTMAEGIRGTALYTREQMKELVEYCLTLGIEIVPEFEIPAHAHYLVKNYPEFACSTDLENPSPAVLCASNEKVYTFYAQLIDELCSIFPSKYIHMGGDELSFNDFPDWNYHENWNDCKLCQKKMHDEGMHGIQDLYYYVVNRIYDLVSQRGKTLIMYNDQIDISKPVPLPKDILIQFWRIASKLRGPYVDCTYEKFLQQGFKVIVSPYEYTYVDLEEYATPEKTSCFDFKNYQDTLALSDGVFGGETCAWEYGNPEYTHYTFSFTSATILLLEKMWNSKQVVYDLNYRKSLTKLILGNKAPVDYDIFQLFGSIMPPRINNTDSHFDVRFGSLEETVAQSHRKILANLKDTYSPIYFSKLLAFAESICSKWEELK